MIKAVLIDLDGFLIDSEKLYFQANKLYFQRFNFTFTRKNYEESVGKKFDKWVESLGNFNKSGEIILQERDEIFYGLVEQKISLMPYAFEMLSLLHKHFQTSLVTSSRTRSVDLVFSKIKIKQFFNVIVTGELVDSGKPDPECFLTAAKLLDVKPEECLVLEDSPNGILAGKNAGMKVISLPNKYISNVSLFDSADKIVESLSEISLDMIRSL